MSKSEPFCSWKDNILTPKPFSQDRLRHAFSLSSIQRYLVANVLSQDVEHRHGSILQLINNVTETQYCSVSTHQQNKAHNNSIVEGRLRCNRSSSSLHTPVTNTSHEHATLTWQTVWPGSARQQRHAMATAGWAWTACHLCSSWESRTAAAGTQTSDTKNTDPQQSVHKVLSQHTCICRYTFTIYFGWKANCIEKKRTVQAPCPQLHDWSRVSTIHDRPAPAGSSFCQWSWTPMCIGKL